MSSENSTQKIFPDIEPLINVFYSVLIGLGFVSFAGNEIDPASELRVSLPFLSYISINNILFNIYVSLKPLLIFFIFTILIILDWYVCEWGIEFLKKIELDKPTYNNRTKGLRRNQLIGIITLGFAMSFGLKLDNNLYDLYSPFLYLFLYTVIGLFWYLVKFPAINKDLVDKLKGKLDSEKEKFLKKMSNEELWNSTFNLHKFFIPLIKKIQYSKYQVFYIRIIAPILSTIFGFIFLLIIFDKSYLWDYVIKWVFFYFVLFKLITGITSIKLIQLYISPDT